MAAKCSVCDNDLVPGSRFCSTCGAPVYTGNPARGANLTRMAFVFCGVLPGIAAMFELVAIILRRLSVLVVIDVLAAVAMLVLFALLYRGHQWAATSIGWIMILSELIALVASVFLLATRPHGDLSLAMVVLRALWLLFAIYFITSKDVRAFVASRSAGLTPG